MEQNEQDVYQKQIKGLLSQSDASNWTHWLFDIQNFLVENGFYEGATIKERSDYATKFSCLNDFFKDIDTRERSKVDIDVLPNN
jgi:hypothetical protein